MSDEARVKISKYQTGRVRSAETRKRMSEGRAESIILNGIEYRSKSEAAQAFGVRNSTESQWIKRGGTKNVVVG